MGLMAMNAFIFLTFFSNSLGMFLAGELLLGITWGFFVSEPFGDADIRSPSLQPMPRK